jgi:hypothetical protein
MKSMHCWLIFLLILLSACGAADKSFAPERTSASAPLLVPTPMPKQLLETPEPKASLSGENALNAGVIDNAMNAAERALSIVARRRYILDVQEDYASK